MRTYRNEQKGTTAAGWLRLSRALRAALAGLALLAAGGCVGGDGAFRDWPDFGEPLPDYVLDSGLHWRPAGWLDDERLAIMRPIYNPTEIAIWRPFDDPRGEALEPVALEAPLGEIYGGWRIRCIRDGWIRYTAGKAPDPQTGREIEFDWWGRVDQPHELVTSSRTVDGVREPVVPNQITCGLDRVPIARTPAELPQRYRIYEPLLPGDGFYVAYEPDSRTNRLKIWTGEGDVIAMPKDGTDFTIALQPRYAPWENAYYFNYTVHGKVNPGYEPKCEFLHVFQTDKNRVEEFCLPDSTFKSDWRSTKVGFVALMSRGFLNPNAHLESGLILKNIEDSVRHVLSGHIKNGNHLNQSDRISVSPNGCNIAVYHSGTTSYFDERLEDEPSWQRDDTVKVIDICAAKMAISTRPEIQLEYP